MDSYRSKKRVVGRQENGTLLPLLLFYFVNKNVLVNIAVQSWEASLRFGERGRRAGCDGSPLPAPCREELVPCMILPAGGVAAHARAVV